MKKLITSLLSFVLVVALASAALGAAVMLLVPASADLRESAVVLCDDRGGVQLTAYAQRSQLLDRYGNPMPDGTLFADQDRAPVSLDQVPPHVIAAVLAIEDRSFYQHEGVDVRGTLRAFRNNAEGESVQGGSTITQQLVKNTLINNPARTVKRKLREACLARELERTFTKDQILEQYLNTIYFGRGAYGIKAAAERYYNKPDPMQLTVGEAAMLAGLIASPEGRNPLDHPRRARQRRNEVLAAMHETGVLTERQVTRYKRENVPRQAYYLATPGARSFFVAEVTKRLQAVGSPLGDNAYNLLFRGGLRIHTTYDPMLQFLAQSAVNSNLDPLGAIPFTASMVVIENGTGAVRAIVGGRNFDENKYNLATQGQRQAGSTFKVFTAAAALDAGYSPNDLVSGSSCRFYYPMSTDFNPEGWSAGTHTSGTTTMTRQLASSINCAFARLQLSMGHGTVGPQKVIDMARRLGVDEAGDPSIIPPVTSATLGTGLVSPLSMASSYSTIASDGIHHDPSFVTRIEDSEGNVIWEADGIGERVLDPNIARSLTSMMTEVIDNGTASNARIGRPAAGKTGTTNDAADAWFVGYVPQFTAAVWMGDPVAKTPMTNVAGIEVFGGTYPAKIWAAFMRAALENQPILPFIPPDEARWPSTQFVDENGRRFVSFRPPPRPTPTPTPTPDTTPSPTPDTTPDTTPSSVPATTPTTAAALPTDP